MIDNILTRITEFEQAVNLDEETVGGATKQREIAYARDRLLIAYTKQENEINRLLQGHGERKVCEHQVDNEKDGACSDCYSWVISQLEKQEQISRDYRNHLEAVCDWAGHLVKSTVVDAARARLAEKL